MAVKDILILILPLLLLHYPTSASFRLSWLSWFGLISDLTMTATDILILILPLLILLPLPRLPLLTLLPLLIWFDFRFSHGVPYPHPTSPPPAFCYLCLFGCPCLCGLSQLPRNGKKGPQKLKKKISDPFVTGVKRVAPGAKKHQAPPLLTP